MTMTHRDAQSIISTARNQNAGKPLQNNTRLHRRGEGPGAKFAVRLHNTDVVTINTDGTYTLAAGGYHTVTTLARIREYAPVNYTLYSERGEWYLMVEPDPSDPQPERVEREIPKPFESTDPGPEPVKNDEDCVSGQLVTTEHVNEAVEVWRKDLRPGEEVVEVLSESSIGTDGDYDRVKVLRSWNSHVYIGEGSQSYYDDGWTEFSGQRHGSTHIINGDETVKYVQCSHCAEFDAKHEGWRMRMHGPRWHRGTIDQNNGYKVYAKMMERFGTTEAWQEAYIADFRARREFLKLAREWEQRNRVPFYDGITVNSEGYVPRKRNSGPSKVKLARHEREVARIKKLIDKYISEYIDALKAGMPMPSGGDCWYCLLRTTEGETMGDIGDNSHLWSHIEDHYYVPSLAVNALRERGYKDVGIYMWLDMNADTQTMGGGDRYENVRRDIRNYMRKRMVPDAPTK